MRGHGAVPHLIDAQPVRMAEGAEPDPGGMGGQRLEAELPLLIGIQPDQFASDIGMQGAMDGDQPVLDRRLQRQAGQPADIISRQPGPRPIDGAGGQRIEAFRRDLAGDRPVMVAGDADSARVAQQPDARGRIGVVADDIA